MKIAIICVSYNSYPDTIKMVESIRQAQLKMPSMECLTVLVCDNSTQGNSDFLLNKISEYDFNYLKLENIGYFPAFHQGLKYLEKNNFYVFKDFDYVIVSNVDLQLDSKFFNNMYGLNINKDVGVVAPSILSNLTKEDINPKVMVRPKKLKMKLLRLGFQNLWFYKSYTWLSVKKAEKRGKNKYLHHTYNSNTSMYAAHGSIMVFTKEYFRRQASVNYPRFLFGEEVFVAEEAKNKGLTTIYKPELVVYDNEHGATSREADRFISNEHVKSYNYLLENYY